MTKIVLTSALDSLHSQYDKYKNCPRDVCAAPGSLESFLCWDSTNLGPKYTLVDNSLVSLGYKTLEISLAKGFMHSSDTRGVHMFSFNPFAGDAVTTVDDRLRPENHPNVISILKGLEVIPKGTPGHEQGLNVFHWMDVPAKDWEVEEPEPGKFFFLPRRGRRKHFDRARPLGTQNSLPVVATKRERLAKHAGGRDDRVSGGKREEQTAAAAAAARNNPASPSLANTPAGTHPSSGTTLASNIRSSNRIHFARNFLPPSDLTSAGHPLSRFGQLSLAPGSGEERDTDNHLYGDDDYTEHPLANPSGPPPAYDVESNTRYSTESDLPYRNEDIPYPNENIPHQNEDDFADTEYNDFPRRRRQQYTDQSDRGWQRHATYSSPSRPRSGQRYIRSRREIPLYPTRPSSGWQGRSDREIQEYSTPTRRSRQDYYARPTGWAPESYWWRH